MKAAVFVILFVATGCERNQPAVQEPAPFGVSWEVIGDDGQLRDRLANKLSQFARLS
jgi:hypothetical protein